MFDPYNQISFVQLNRRRRKDKEREESEKIYNQPAPVVKKIFLCRNNASSRPKLFVWRVWRLPRLESLIFEGGKFLGLRENEAIRLFDSNGVLIENGDSVVDGNVYYIVGEENFFKSSYNNEPRSMSESASGNYVEQTKPEKRRNSMPKSLPLLTPTSITSQKVLQEGRKLHHWSEDESSETEMRNDHLSIKPESDFRRSNLPKSRPASAPSFSYQKTDAGRREESAMKMPSLKNAEDFMSENLNLNDFGNPIQSYDAASSIPPATLSTAIPFSRLGQSKGLKRENKKAYHVLERSLSAQKYGKNFDEIPPIPFESATSNYGYSSNIEELQNSNTNREYNPFTFPKKKTLKKQATAETSKSLPQDQTFEQQRKHKPKRISSPNAIYNRPDQTHPDAYIIYVFLNGHGIESQCIHFQRIQLEKGMNFVLELIAKRYGVKPGKLCNMDGHRVRSVKELMSRGAYILVPVSQKFRDAWYFLPDNALDTSVDNDIVQQRDEQKRRILKGHESRLTALQTITSRPSVNVLTQTMNQNGAENTRQSRKSKGATKKTAKSISKSVKSESGLSQQDDPKSLQEESGPVRPGKDEEPFAYAYKISLVSNDFFKI